MPQLESPSGALDGATPRTSTESAIHGIWTEVLEIDEISVDQNFFDLGGNSVRMAQLLKRLSSDLGHEVPIVEAFKRPTIAELAQFIRGQHERASDVDSSQDDTLRPLVLVRPGSDRPPLYIFHPVSGLIYFYFMLAHHMETDRPVYAVQDPSVDPTRTPFENLEEMASFYVDAILENSATGPFLLAGWSLGGLLAYEVGRQMEERGLEVSFVGMIDTHPPATEGDKASLYETVVTVLTETWFWARLLYSLTPFLRDHYYLQERQRVQDETGPNRRLWNLLTSRFVGQADVVSSMKSRRIPLMARIPSMARTFYMIHCHARHSEAYLPPTSDLRITLFQCEEEIADDGDSLGPDYGWSELARGGVTTRTIPGNHMNLIRPPNVEGLAEILSQELDGGAPSRVQSHLNTA